jgi:hypothetical protein
MSVLLAHAVPGDFLSVFELTPQRSPPAFTSEGGPTMSTVRRYNSCRAAKMSGEASASPADQDEAPIPEEAELEEHQHRVSELFPRSGLCNDSAGAAVGAT